MPDFTITASTGFASKAEQLAQQWGLTYLPKVESGLTLILDEYGLGLQDLNDAKLGAVRVDFSNKAMGFRTQQASIKNEAIARACGLKGNQQRTVLDATAGLARDAWVLASLGARVMLLERSPVVAALLRDGLSRAVDDPESPEWIAERLQLLANDSLLQLQPWPYEIPDVIYLDPMFPHKKKTALVKKEMRLFQQLLGPDKDADKLLTPALHLAKKRVVVKRPDYAPFLNEHVPSMQIKSKKHRFDVYLTDVT
ncbi:MAG: class I SAM-dependent methyltransferase [Aestuariibacter sp.]